MNGISCCTSLVKCNHTLFAQDGIHQCGFAHIRTTDYGEHRMISGHFIGHFVRKLIQYRTDQIPHTITVCRRNHKRLYRQTQFVKLSRHHRTVCTLTFVHRQKHRATTHAQFLCNQFVLWGHAHTSIHQEHHCIGFIHRLQGLLGHFKQNATVYHRLKTACIHHQIRLITHATMTIMAVTGQTWQIGYQCVFTAGKAIKQGRFADIRSADQHDSWFHNTFLHREGRDSHTWRLPIA